MNSPTYSLRLAVEAIVNEIHVALPGKIVRYDHTKQEADVKPLLKRVYKDGEILDLPVVPSVPVVWPRTKDAVFSMPLNPGDGVLLIFAERSLDKWLSEGGNVIPDDIRKYDLSDGIAIPGLYSFADKSPIKDNDSVVLKYKEAEFKIANDGLVSINGENFTVKL